MKQESLLVSVLTSTALALVACGAGGRGEPRTVVIGTTDVIDSLDPADAYATHDWELFKNTNLGLMTFAPGTTDLTLGVAVDFPQVSQDGLTYTFKIEPGWQYPDGTELVAGDFVRGVNRALTLEGDVSGLVTAYVEGIEAPDDQTVVFHLHSPRSDFPQIVTGAAYMPLPEGAFPDDALEKFPETVYGVGPYQVIEYDIEEQTVLERNPNYKPGFPEHAPDRVIIRYFQEASQLALAVESGEIDIAWRSFGPSQVQRLSSQEGLTLHTVRGGHIRFLAPNHTLAPFNDRNVRQALAYLVDREEITDRAMQGTAIPLYSQVPPDFPGANEAFLERYGGGPDVEAAEALLRASGYSEDNPLAFDLAYPPAYLGPQTASVVQVLAEQFEATPLIDVNPQSEAWGTYISGLLEGETPIGYLAWQFDYPDISNYLEPFAASNFSVLGFYNNPEMDELLRAAAVSADEAEREQLYGEAQELFAEDVVTLPLTLEPEYAVFRNDTIDSLIIGSTLNFHFELIDLK